MVSTSKNPFRLDLHDFLGIHDEVSAALELKDPYSLLDLDVKYFAKGATASSDE
jgi:hypothetical protein